MDKCNDYGDPDVPECLGEPDDRFTMRFDDIGERPLLWCSACGPRAKSMEEALTEALDVGGTEFADKLEFAIETERNKRH